MFSSSVPVRRLAIVCSTAVLGALALAGSPALAATTHEFVGSFGSFGNPNGLAVDAGGDVYVADIATNSVQKFDASGNPVNFSSLGSNTLTGAATPATSFSFPASYGNPAAIAIDNSGSASAGDVYVMDEGHDVIDKFDSTGAYVGQITGTSGGPFSDIYGIGVDGSGDLWVYQPGSEVDEFSPGGAFLSSFPFNYGSDPAFAVDPSGDTYAMRGCDCIEKFDLTGTDLGQVDNSSTDIAVAVDPATSHVYIDQGSSVAEWDTSAMPGSSATEVSQFGSAQLTGSSGGGIAVSPTASGDVYVADPNTGKIDIYGPLVTLPDVTTGEATNVRPTSATLSGHVDPAGGGAVISCQFQYVDQADYQPSASDPYSSGQTATCSPATPYSSATDVTADITGLQANTTYHFRLEATNSNGTTFGSDQTFGTGASVDSESVSDVGVTDATLHALINPNSTPTSYHFEYGTSAGVYPNSTPEASLGSGDSDVSALALLSGLQPGTTYHWRVVATNSVGTTDGADEAFTTYQAPPVFGPCPNDQLRYGHGAHLPDCRAYEQASPVDKGGSDVSGGPNLVQAAPGGSAITFFDYLGLPGVFGSTSLFPSYVASRGAAGWSTQNVMPPASVSWEGTSPSGGAYYVGWSPDLSMTLAFGSSVSASQQNAVVLSDTAHGTYRVLATGSFGPQLAGLSADDSRVVFEDQAQLLPSAAAGQNNVYEFDQTSGQLYLVGVLPVSQGGGAPPGGSFTGPYHLNTGDTGNGGARAGMYTQTAISSDGSRVFFTAGQTGQLYVREDPTSATPATVPVSASQKTNGSGPGGTDPNGAQPAAFMTATPDGSRVLFTSPEELTNDATTGSADQGNDLYAYDVQTGTLRDLTPDTNDPNGAEVQGVLGASSDGSYVYFVANGVLANGASAGNCTGIAISRGSSGTCNLYLWHDGTIAFIAQLSPTDRGDNSDDAVDWEPTPDAFVGSPEKTSRVTPDGQTLLFRSARNDGVGEFYRYSAASGQLECVSCDPSGAPPVGPATLQSIHGLIGITKAPVLTRNLSDDGDRVFFESSDPLLPAATNGVQNVYEWEADGSGSCQSSADGGGCLYLLSTGTSPDPSYFADASASGDDAFLFTSQPLVGQDQDQLVDVYDARVDGGLASQNPPAATPCSGEGCKPPPSVAPPPPTAASVTFAGPGNVSPGATTPRVKVLSKVVHGSTFFVRVRVPSPGRITITGSGVKTARRSVSRAGTYKLKVSLTAKATKALRHKRRLKLKLRVAYAPSAGRASAATVVLTVEPALRGPPRHGGRAAGHDRGGAK